MNRLKRLLRAVDEFQQQHAWLAFPVAVWKKFGDDQAGNLAALIAYSALVAIFPLLLLLITLLDIVLKNNPELKQKMLKAAVDQYPVIGPQLAEPERSHQAHHRRARRLVPADLHAGAVLAHPVGVVDDRGREP